MVVSRVLSLWSSAAFDCLQAEPRPSLLCQSLHGECLLPSRLLRHVYAHWEHPLDGVRHQTRILFRNLLLLHQHCGDPASDPTSDPYVIQLTHSMLALDWHMKGKYGSLACLAEHLGAEYLLKLDASLPSRLLALMGDQTLATYSSELLERLFVSHKAQLCVRFRDDHGWMDDWHKTWVIPLLEVLCTARLEQTTYILDYFLPKLLRCNPASLECMVKALQDMSSNSDDEPLKQPPFPLNMMNVMTPFCFKDWVEKQKPALVSGRPREMFGAQFETEVMLYGPGESETSKRTSDGWIWQLEGSSTVSMNGQDYNLSVGDCLLVLELTEYHWQRAENCVALHVVQNSERKRPF